MKSTKSALPSRAQRQRLLEARRTIKMAGSAHAYVRGSTVQFYRWLDERAEASIPKGPSSVVELAATHEAAYLEHCRLYALA